MPHSDINTKVVEWLNWDQNEVTREQIKALQDDNRYDDLYNLFNSRLGFGTAGLRGKMGPGPAQMNDLVIIQTSQGLGTYLKEAFKERINQGVVIGYDGRYNSKRFAELSATVFLNQNIPVYMFSEVCPTPFVPFTVSKYKCVAGVMVTASHNPKDDNGYKVYWDNGAQIIAPHDKNIQKHILNNLKPWETSWDTSILTSSKEYSDPLSEVMTDYFSKLKNAVLSSETNLKTSLNFTYTPMHGVGYLYMKEAFNVAGFKPFVIVEEQKDPDPEFSTVKFPNPEEGKSSLNLAILTAEANNCTVILANDPDADRLAVAEKDKQTGQWHVFSGNELGALLGWWCLFLYKERYPTGNLEDVYMMSSTVSSKILNSISKIEGFNFLETLTGFKWMGNKTAELMTQGKTVLFAFEEAIGFMCGTNVLDKDGISAGVCAAELAAYLKAQGKTLADKLQELYTQYGHHLSDNSYFLCYNKEVIDNLFNRLRNFSGAENTYPRSILNGKYTITGVRDLTSGYDDSQPNNKAILPVSKSAQMITFSFSNGLVATLRTSGTEPKIKYYTELCATPDQQDLDALYETLQEMVSAIIEEFLQPDVNGLIGRSTSIELVCTCIHT